jgi:benzoylformate decarboxylase
MSWPIGAAGESRCRLVQGSIHPPARGLRRVSPWSSIRCALWMMRSRIASASVGFLSIPMDDFDKPCLRVPAIRNVSTRLGADKENLSPVIMALSNAQSPVLVIGGAVDQGGGWDHAVRLADKLRCKVWAAPEEGRPGFPEASRFYQGALPGAIGPLCEALAGHDIIVVIGAPVFRYYPYVPGDYIPAGASLFHITDDPSEAARAPVGDSVLADPGAAAAYSPTKSHSPPALCQPACSSRHPNGEARSRPNSCTR